MMRLVDIGYAIPVVFLFIFMAQIFKPSLTLLIVLLIAVSWLVPARLVRGETLSLRTREFVQAVQVMGGRSGRIIIRHIIPNSIGTINQLEPLIAWAHEQVDVSVSSLLVLAEPIVSAAAARACSAKSRAARSPVSARSATSSSTRRVGRASSRASFPRTSSSSHCRTCSRRSWSISSSS